MLGQISVFDYCEVSFDTGFEVIYPFDRKCDDKHFNKTGSGLEAVVFKRKWTALLSAEKGAPQRRVKIYRNPWAVHLNHYHQNVRLFITFALTSYFGFQIKRHSTISERPTVGPRRSTLV